MRSSFDAGVVSVGVLDFVRRAQALVDCRASGELPLSAIHLHHRAVHEVTLVCRTQGDVHRLFEDLPRLIPTASLQSVVAHPAHARATTIWGGRAFEIEIRHDPHPPLAAPDVVEKVVTDSLLDLRAGVVLALTRAPRARYLVDLYFLEQVGYPLEQDLLVAIEKDPTVDPGFLAWRLHDYPLAPIPPMRKVLVSLVTYRDDVARRLRRVAVGLALGG
jgi:hypothetical protein